MKSNAVKVGHWERVFVVDTIAHDFKRQVQVILAQRGERHNDAAKRAKVSKVYWSRLFNKEQLNTSEFETIARGLGMHPDALAKTCNKAA